MMPKFYTAVLSACLFLAFPTTSLFAQTDNEITATILHKDSLFWRSYNTCDTTANKTFFTADIEFYHDKGGLTVGAENLAASLKNNLCSNPAFRLRREAIAVSVHVFPLRKNNEVYGAVISGEHVFYITEDGKPEYLDGQAFFTHVWLLKDGDWKMARILSYNHHAAEQKNSHTEIKLSDADLVQFVGKYNSPKGEMSVQKSGNGLLLTLQNKTFVLHPETANRFFIKDRDLTFEFVENSKHAVLKMLVRENGSVVEEAVFISRK